MNQWWRRHDGKNGSRGVARIAALGVLGCRAYCLDGSNSNELDQQRKSWTKRLETIYKEDKTKKKNDEYKTQVAFYEPGAISIPCEISKEGSIPPPHIAFVPCVNDAPPSGRDRVFVSRVSRALRTRLEGDDWDPNRYLLVATASTRNYLSAGDEIDALDMMKHTVHYELAKRDYLVAKHFLRTGKNEDRRQPGDVAKKAAALALSGRRYVNVCFRIVDSKTGEVAPLPRCIEGEGECIQGEKSMRETGEFYKWIAAMNETTTQVPYDYPAPFVEHLLEKNTVKKLLASPASTHANMMSGTLQMIKGYAETKEDIRVFDTLERVPHVLCGYKEQLDAFSGEVQDKEEKSKAIELLGGAKLLPVVKKTGTFVVLHGPPGCGKTLMVRQSAAESDSKLILLKGSGFKGSFQGETQQKAMFHFTLINALACCYGSTCDNTKVIVFLDEGDEVLGSRSNSDLTSRQVVTTFLKELNEVGRPYKFVTATNHYGSLDKAVRSRVTVRIEFSKPDFNGCLQMIQNRLKHLSDKEHRILARFCVQPDAFEMEDFRGQKPSDKMAPFNGRGISQALDRVLMKCQMRCHQAAKGKQVDPQDVSSFLPDLALVLDVFISSAVTAALMETGTGKPKSSLEDVLKLKKKLVDDEYVQKVRERFLKGVEAHIKSGGEMNECPLGEVEVTDETITTTASEEEDN